MNRLYFGNNLPVLSQHVEADSVDLVYLDPPFNSNEDYNVFYEREDSHRDTAQRSVFQDSWDWGDEAKGCFEYVLAHGGPPASILNALRNALGRSAMMAYLAMMTARLLELRRVMKPTASLYLHCDSTASHYLKIILDSIFGPRSFRNEIIWKRTGSHGGAKRWGPVHDTILFYTVSSKYTWNQVTQAYEPGYLDAKYRHTDARGRFQDVSLTGAGTRKGDSGLSWNGYDPAAKGRHWAVPSAIGADIPGFGEMTPQEKLSELDARDLLYWPESRGERTFPRVRQYPAEGVRAQDIITDIPPINSQASERVGYPTQKPVALLKRIIEASSNRGDVVLDPFCGCGTTVHAATDLGREWIGIDVSYYGIRLIQRRLAANFGPNLPIEVRGIPADLASAEALADSAPYAFQQWAVDELGCQIWNGGKKGADGGIDGEMWFFAGPGGPGRLLVQVKGGRKTTVAPVREFMRVMDREQAQMGVFVTRAAPTAEMRQEAADAGKFKIGQTNYPRLQFVSMEAWFNGQRPQMPTPIPLQIPQDRTRTKPPKRPDPRQPQFKFVFPGGDFAVPEGQVINPKLIPDERLRSDVA